MSVKKGVRLMGENCINEKTKNQQTWLFFPPIFIKWKENHLLKAVRFSLNVYLPILRITKFWIWELLPQIIAKLPQTSDWIHKVSQIPTKNGFFKRPDFFRNR